MVGSSEQKGKGEMVELGAFGATPRDASPDSVIFTLESNFSLFSSASASVDRCSFASDAHDRDSLASEISLHLAGRERDSSSGPDPDPNSNPNKPAVHKHSRLSRKADKAKVRIQDEDGDVEDNNHTIDSARSSFSLALKECQERRSRSEALSRKSDKRRPASVDFNNPTASSPRLEAVKKSSMATRQSGTFPSPGTPNYRHANVGLQKGWSSERVPLQSSAGMRNVNAGFLPFNNGRTLPSKWEDAERWIFSPVSGDGGSRPSVPQPQRRPKSKSGPLGPPGIAYYSQYSPAMPMFEGRNIKNYMAGSPFSAEVIAADGFRNSAAEVGEFAVRGEPCMGRSVSVHGCSELLSQSSSVGLQDEKLNQLKDAATDISRAVSRRDMATQMSPEGSTCSSPKRTLSFATSPPSALSIVELPGGNSSKTEVKDVQVDERVMITRWSKKNRYRISGKGSGNSDDWKKKDMEAQSSAWDISDAVKSVTVKREEAKITAWENLQKAKAEAAIRKLEMKMEKKRSLSMDKIMKKLRSAQKRAQEMRSSVLARQVHQVSRTSHKALIFRRTRPGGSLSGCFTCHVF